MQKEDVHPEHNKKVNQYIIFIIYIYIYIYIYIICVYVYTDLKKENNI